MSTLPAVPDTAPGMATPQDPTQWGPVLDLECDLSLELPVPGFTVAELLRLDEQSVLDSKWPQGEDVPVRVNGQLVAWAEFEVVAGRLAMRITEWA